MAGTGTNSLSKGRWCPVSDRARHGVPIPPTAVSDEHFVQHVDEGLGDLVLLVEGAAEAVQRGVGFLCVGVVHGYVESGQSQVCGGCEGQVGPAPRWLQGAGTNG